MLFCACIVIYVFVLHMTTSGNTCALEANYQLLQHVGNDSPSVKPPDRPDPVRKPVNSGGTRFGARLFSAAVARFGSANFGSVLEAPVPEKSGLVKKISPFSKRKHLLQ